MLCQYAHVTNPSLQLTCGDCRREKIDFIGQQIDLIPCRIGLNFTNIRNLYNLKIAEVKTKCNKTRAEKFQDHRTRALRNGGIYPNPFCKGILLIPHTRPWTLIMRLFMMAVRRHTSLMSFFLESFRIDDEHIPTPDATGNVERTWSDIVLTEKRYWWLA